MRIVAKVKVGKSEEEELREGFYRRLRKELNGLVQGVSEKRMCLMRFKDGCDKDMNLNQLTVVAVEKIPMNKEPEVLKIYVIHDNTVDFEKELYHAVYVMNNFMKKDGVDRKEEHSYMDTYPDKEDMEDVRPDKK